MVTRTLLMAAFLGAAACPVADSAPTELPASAGGPSLSGASETAVLRSSNRDEDTLRVTLDRAVELALAGRPAVRAAEERVLAAEAASRQARARRNPEAVLEVEGFAGDRPGFDQAEVTLGLAGGLDLFGRGGARGRVADAALQAERARRSSTRREVEERVRLAFHEILAAREVLEMAALILEVARDTRDAVRGEVAAGKTATLRGIQTEIGLESARLRHDTARTRLDLAGTRLSRLVASTDGRTGPVVAVGKLRDRFPALDPDSLAAELDARHPDLAAGRWTAEVHHRRGQQIGRERWPELGFQVGYRRDRGSEISDWVGGLSVELPILDRGREGAREAQRLASAAQDRTQETALDLLDELERTLESGRAAASLLERCDAELLPRAREAMRLVRLGYEEGKFGYLDLVDAQRALALSRAERARALIDLDGALTGLEILTGRTLTVPVDRLED